MSARTAQEMAIKFRQRDARIARIRDSARQERLADEARDRMKGREV